MDFFKLLTRGTKQKGSSLSTSSTTKLPSAGSNANPQLFHDESASNRGTKRKRIIEQSTQDEVVADEEVDFFAEKTSKPDSKARSTTAKEEVQKTAAANRHLDLLDEAECRQILKSHRIKLTALPLTSTKKGIEKSKKSSKKRRKEKETEKPIKSEPKQLYPQPLTSFSDLSTTFGAGEKLTKNIALQAYKIPTEVQMGSLPLLFDPKLALHESDQEVSAHSDLLVIAPTGSGKTLAFLIPIIDQIHKRRREKHGVFDGPEAVIVAPTKELASQIVNEGRKLAAGMGLRVVGMRKGMEIAGSQSSLGAEAPSTIEPTAETMSDKEGSQSEDEEVEDEDDEKDQEKRPKGHQPPAKADILVTTPLTLLHSLTKGDDKSTLPTVRHLVLDEADVLLDQLFRDQMLGIWDSCTNPKLRVSLWSATMGSNIETLTMTTIKARAEKLGLKPRENLLRMVIGLKDSAIPNITHKLVYAATETGKLIALRQLIRPTAKTVDSQISLRPPFLIFTQTIPRAVALHSELLYDIPVEAGGSSRVAVLHSDLSETKRDQVMTKFRNGEIWVLITTDILSRGVDFRGINGVVNYDVPNSGASYIHRVGRTGRAGRDGGIAVTFYTKEDIPYVKNVANIIVASEKQAGKTEAESSVQKWLLDALPTPSKREKQQLKRHGVEARRTQSTKSKISTRSGFEKRVQDRRKGAIEGSRRRKEKMESEDGLVESDNEWGGFDNE